MRERSWTIFHRRATAGALLAFATLGAGVSAHAGIAPAPPDSAATHAEEFPAELGSFTTTLLGS